MLAAIEADISHSAVILLSSLSLHLSYRFAKPATFSKQRAVSGYFTMTLRTLQKIPFAFLVLTLLSCGDNHSLIKSNVPESDTVKIMRLLLDSAFYRQNLTSISNLTRNSPFGDTVIFRNEIYQGDTNISRYFPKNINGLNLKFLSQSQICSLAIALRNDTAQFPEFLELRNFKKVDTTYEVYLRSTCVIPQFDKEGHHLYKKGKLEGIDTLPCIFGMMCGGGISMTFTKQGDSLQSKIIGRSSD